MSSTAQTQMDQAQQVERWDAIEQYFVCISECSLHDGDCVTHCVEVLKIQQCESG